MIVVNKKENCCGCNACGDICPTGAITYVADEEGFWYPKIDTQKCINCKQCEKVCPCVNECQSRKENKKEPDCYAAEHKSMEVIFQSTSGGVFSALADVMYTEKGYVAGAVHNDDFSVSQFLSKDKNDLKKLRRSKDLQSNAVGFYKSVKRVLEEGNKVLVCGLPCQISALLNYLQKGYDNLITVDLICAGVNSPKVWRKYLDYIEEINGSKIVWTENKSKEYGWKNLTQKFVFENGDEFFDTRKTNLFTKGYIESHLYCRPSCYECRFKGFPRVGDITIGDFWGISNFSKEHNSDMGTNLVLVNSDKGQQYFLKAARRLNYEKTPLEWALPGNPALTESISVLSKERKEFFQDLDLHRFDKVISKYSLKNRIRFRTRIKKKIKFLYYIIKVTRLYPIALFQTFRYSGLKNLFHQKGIVCSKNCHINIDKSAHIEFNGVLTFGRKDKFPSSKQESRLFIGPNGSLKVLGNFEIDAESEIIVFENGELIIHGAKIGYSDANAGLTIVCGQRIVLGHDVGIGRNVTIRDTNGASHFMNTTGYRPSRPVEICEKAWLCEGCSIMPGVRVGRGSIIGASSMVTKSIPDHAMASGNPASIVQENVLWKW